MNDQIKVIPSILYTTEGEKLTEEIKKDLEILDPEPEEAQASLDKAEIKKSSD